MKSIKNYKTTSFSFETAPSGTPEFFTTYPTSNKIASVTLPFTFTDLDLNTTNHIYVSTNGYLALGTSVVAACSTCSTAKYIPDPSSTSPKNIIAGLWDTAAKIN